MKNTHTHTHTPHMFWACVRPRGCWEEWRDVTLCFSACWFWMWPISEAEQHRVWEWRRRQERRRGSLTVRVCALSTESQWDERRNGAAYDIMNIMTNKELFSHLWSFFSDPPLNSARWLDTEALRGQDVLLSLVTWNVFIWNWTHLISFIAKIKLNFIWDFICKPSK